MADWRSGGRREIGAKVEDNRIVLQGVSEAGQEEFEEVVHDSR